MRSDEPSPTVLELRSETVPARALLGELRAHGALLPLLARQHFVGQFRAARLGLAWSALQPLIRGAVLAVVFTMFVPIPLEEGLPYPAFIFAGTAAYAYLSESITSGTTSITGSLDLTSKVYFPRLLLPAMPAAAALPSFLITLLIVLGIVLGFGVVPGLTVLALPFAIALSFALVTALSSVLALLHVYFRDVGPFVTAMIGVVFYATPVIYPLELAGGLRWLIEMNPLTGAVSAVRWSLFGPAYEDVGNAIWWTLGWTVVLALVAVVAYRRHERICVDRL